MKLISWEYIKNLNEINELIRDTEDEQYKDLKSADDIVSITYDSNHGRYLVFWKYEN